MKTSVSDPPATPGMVKTKGSLTMIYQYAATVTIICVALVILGSVYSDPYPNTYNWADRMGILAMVVGFIAFWVTLITLIWGV